MTRFSINSLILGSVFSMAVGTAQGADIYPFELVKSQPAIGKTFSKLTAPVAAKHAWIKKYGVVVPVSEVTAGNEIYQVLAGCKPHDCPSEKYVVLIAKGTGKGIGAFVVNRYASGSQASPNPVSSSVTWLGQPDDAQRAVLARQLF